MGDVEVREMRASEIEEGDLMTEFGMDTVRVAKVDWHGDTVLITTTAGGETALDRDEVVLVERGELT